MTVLSFRSVTKRFGAFTAVDELSFEIPQGQVFGFLGRNGAGKTTSLRMVLDILQPTSGQIEVLGQAPGGDSRKQIGFLPEERGLYRRMTVLDTIRYFGELKAMTAHDAKASATALIDKLDLSAWAGKRVEQLSKGMAQKVQLASALVNSPRLVILDEPFSGLDPVSQGQLEQTIADFAATGATIVFSTHVMQHAERLCDRLLLLSRGRKVFEGTQSQARAMLPARLSLSALDDPSALPMIASAVAGPPGDDGWTAWEVLVKPGAQAQDVLEACFERGLKLRRFDEHKPSLHDVFIHLAGDDAQTNGAEASTAQRSAA